MKIDAEYLKEKVSDWNCSLVINRNSTKSHKYFIVDNCTTQVLVSAYLLEDAERLFDNWVIRWKTNISLSGVVVCSDNQIYTCYILINNVKRYVCYDIMNDAWRCSDIPKSFKSFMSCYKSALDYFANAKALAS